MYKILEVCKERDLPFFIDIWEHVRDIRETEEDAIKAYLSRMKLASFRNMTFKDSDYIANMQNKEKIIQILTNDLKYCYCDNCEYSDYERYEDKLCDGCYRKYSNWALSPATAEEIADKIIQSGEIYYALKEELKEGINNAK